MQAVPEESGLQELLGAEASGPSRKAAKEPKVGIDGVMPVSDVWLCVIDRLRITIRGVDSAHVHKAWHDLLTSPPSLGPV